MREIVVGDRVQLRSAASHEFGDVIGEGETGVLTVIEGDLAIVTWESGEMYGYLLTDLKHVEATTPDVQGATCPVPEPQPAPRVEHTFSVGDRVVMSERGIERWGNQSLGGEGVIEHVTQRMTRGDSACTVLWDNVPTHGGYSYSLNDIMLSQVVRQAVVQQAPRTLQVGDVVELNEKGLSEYRHQSGGNKGVVKGDGRLNGWYQVSWNNGSTNSYLLEHLTIVEASTNPKQTPRRMIINLYNARGDIYDTISVPSSKVTIEDAEAWFESQVIRGSISNFAKFTIVDR